MVSPSKMLTLGRADASIALLSLNRIFHGIRLNLRLTTSGSRLPLFCPDSARVVQGERRAELARTMLSRSPHSQSISLMLCKGTTFFVRFQISGIDLGRF